MTNEFMVDKQETLNYINDLTQVINGPPAGGESFLRGAAEQFP